MKSRDDGAASVADAAKIIADIERQLTAARRSLDGLTRARRHSAYLAALGDRDAKSRLAALASDEARRGNGFRLGTWRSGSPESHWYAAQAAEIAARRPRYVPTKPRELVAGKLPPTQEL